MRVLSAVLVLPAVFPVRVCCWACAAPHGVVSFVFLVRAELPQSFFKWPNPKFKSSRRYAYTHLFPGHWLLYCEPLFELKICFAGLGIPLERRDLLGHHDWPNVSVTLDLTVMWDRDTY